MPYLVMNYCRLRHENPSSCAPLLPGRCCSFRRISTELFSPSFAFDKSNRPSTCSLGKQPVSQASIRVRPLTSPSTFRHRIIIYCLGGQLFAHSAGHNDVFLGWNETCNKSRQTGLNTTPARRQGAELSSLPYLRCSLLFAVRTSRCYVKAPSSSWSEKL